MVNNIIIKDCQVFNPIYLMSLLDKSILPISCQEQTDDNYCVSVSKDYVNILSKNEIEYYVKSNISMLKEIIEQNKENYRKILKDMFYNR